MIKIEGVVEDIIYKNEENSYTVLELDHEGTPIVCVGTLPFIQPGESVIFYGEYVNHKNYGKQFKVSSMETKEPETEDNIIAFLSGGLIKGIGAVTATRIVERFHSDTFDVIENEPDRLIEIKGISSRLADSIQNQYTALKETRNIIIELQKLGLSVKEGMMAYEAYGSNAPYIITRNPYRLMDDIRGFGFEKADALAEKIGIEDYRDLRIQSAIRHVLRQAQQSGHTCLPGRFLIQRACSFLNEDEDEIAYQLKNVVDSGYVSESVYNGTEAYADSSAYFAESYIADKLITLSRMPCRTEANERITDEVIEGDDSLSDEQIRAIRMAVREPVSVITGGPGTGKTTILNHILRILESSGVMVSLAAPTGRAAKRMEQSTGRMARTIHRLLEYGANPDDDDDSGFVNFLRDEDNPVEADAVIIDEISMVDIYLMRSLLSALEPGTRLILIGDADQLPSVGPGNVLGDIRKSGLIPETTLTEVFRSSGNIVLNAHRINNGEPIEYYDTGDFVFIETKTPQETMREVYRQYISYHEKENVEVQIICPVKKGLIGVFNINHEIREAINPRSVDKAEYKYGDTLFREGDRIMQVVNNYGKAWYILGKSHILTSSSGVYNGDMGEIRTIDHDERTVTILFEGEKVAEYSFEEMGEIEHSYAVTVHKSQGSEFDVVILPLWYGRSDFLTRNLLYTAMTRAKEKLILIGKRSTIDEMAANARNIHRFTALDHEMKRINEFGHSLDYSDSEGYDDWTDIFPEEE